MNRSVIRRDLALISLSSLLLLLQVGRAYGQLTEVHSFATEPDSGSWLGGVAVGNVNEDPDLEIVVNGPTGIRVYDRTGSLISEFPTNTDGVERPVNAPATLFDLDSDGASEIVFATGAVLAEGNPFGVYAIRGDGTCIWETPLTLDTYTSPESGYQTQAGAFFYDGGLHATLPSGSMLGPGPSAIPVHDMDGDGRAEAVVTVKIRPEPVQDYNPAINDIWGFGEWGTVGESWSGGILILDAATGERRYIYHFCQLVESGIALGIVDPGKGTAVFVLNDSDSIVAFHMVDPHGFFGSADLIGQFGKNQRLQSGGYKQPVDIHTADLNGDGRADVLYAGDNYDPLWQGNRTILDHEGRILWRRWYDFPEGENTTNHWPNAAQMFAVNPDGDLPEVVSFTNRSELMVEVWDGVELVPKGPAWPLDFGGELPSPPAVGDVDGDGEEELVVTTYDPNDLSAPGRLVVLSLQGEIEAEEPVPGGLKNGPVLADLDNDGVLEIVVRECGGTVRVFGTGTGDPGRVCWAMEHRNAERTGGLGQSLYPAKAPMVGKTLPGFGRVLLQWTLPNPTGVQSINILRRRYTDPDFARAAELGADAVAYEDGDLENGSLYIYAIEAVSGEGTFRSAPVPAVPLVEKDLLRNGAMELNGDNGWDKWYTGDIPWEAMIRDEGVSYQGAASMRIDLDGIGGDQSTIKQWNQYGVIDAQIQIAPGRLYSFGMFIRADLDRETTHFLEWDSSYDKYRTDPVSDPIPGLPWPYYFSTHVLLPAGPNDWFYSNRVFLAEPGRTGVSLRHRFQVDGGEARGRIHVDSVFFREVGTEGDDAKVLLSFGSVWRYTDSTQAADWHSPAFDDSGWSEGQAKLGCGSGPQQVVTPLPDSRDRFYFRAEFDYQPELGWLTELVASAMATEGPDQGPGIKEIFLNGSLIPIQDPGLSGGQGNEVRMLDLSPFIHLVAQGRNTLAVRLDNGYEDTWDDVAFDFALKGKEQVEMEDPAPPKLPPGTTGPNDTGADGRDGGGCGCANTKGRGAGKEALFFAILLALLVLSRLRKR